MTFLNSLFSSVAQFMQAHAYIPTPSLLLILMFLLLAVSSYRDSKAQRLIRLQQHKLETLEYREKDLNNELQKITSKLNSAEYRLRQVKKQRKRKTTT